MAHKGSVGVPYWYTQDPRREYLPPCVFLLSFGGGVDLGEELDLSENHKPLFKLPETPSVCGKLTRMENTAAVQP